MDGDDRTSERPSLIMAKASSHPKKNSLEVGLHLLRHGVKALKIILVNLEII